MLPDAPRKEGRVANARTTRREVGAGNRFEGDGETGRTCSVCDRRHVEATCPLSRRAGHAGNDDSLHFGGTGRTNGIIGMVERVCKRLKLAIGPG